jgi:serine/threonine-protein kinase
MTDDGGPLPSSETSFVPGTVVAGKYRIERLIGEGGMGWVVEATHLQLDQRVALKFMRASISAQNPDAIARFLREARAAARVQGDHVARVSDVGTLESGAPYLVMEYLEGQDLDSLLRSRRPLPVPEAMSYAMQACEGLAEAHAAGIVHRDLKPANLFLSRKSDGSVRVKLLDFGISKVVPPAGSTSDGATTGTSNLMGSPLYMAPEQMRSSKHIDRRADIWSMGVILYEMLSGRSPFVGETLPEICARILSDPPAPLTGDGHAVAPELEAVVLRCLEKDPARRFPDVAAVARAIAPFGSGELRTVADRIARLLHGRPGSPSAPPLSAARDETGESLARTHELFGTSAPPTRARRSSATAIGIGTAIAVGTALVAGAALRSRPAIAPAVSAGPSRATELAPSSSIARTSPPMPTTAASAAPLPAESIAAPPAEPTAESPRPPPAPRPGSSARPASKPRPISSSTTKPSPTAGFGGRD